MLPRYVEHEEGRDPAGRFNGDDTRFTPTFVPMSNEKHRVDF
ncbi:MAG TPA: hypothetical protein VFU28_08255 [Vicinamibacterales bacterium]|nr:hypothetical protein [Vicinamibacterales bacterium]